jgi:Endonuclease NucS C-terminal domain
MNEKDIEDIVFKYPSLIEEGLKIRGRQVCVNGKYIDLLFEDRFGQKLIVELKKGTIVRKHIGQIMDYEGHLLSPDDPTVRIMLIGNRVPENFRRSLEHHGIEWKELSFKFLSNFLQEQNDFELLKKLPSLKASMINNSYSQKNDLDKVDKTKIPKKTSEKRWNASSLEELRKIWRDYECKNVTDEVNKSIIIDRSSPAEIVECVPRWREKYGMMHQKQFSKEVDIIAHHRWLKKKGMVFIDNVVSDFHKVL